VEEESQQAMLIKLLTRIFHFQVPVNTTFSFLATSQRGRGCTRSGFESTKDTNSMSSYWLRLLSKPATTLRNRRYDEH